MPYAAKYADEKQTWDVWQDGRNGRWFVVCYVRLHRRYEPFDNNDYATEDEGWNAVDSIERTRNADVMNSRKGDFAAFAPDVTGSFKAAPVR